MQEKAFFISQNKLKSPKVVSLIPPRLSTESIGPKISATRPMREECFNISFQKIGNKNIIHCYGHGGSGWTTLFGSLNKAIQLFINNKPSKTDPIRIIGAGCMGLTASIELSRLGYKIAGITAKSLYDTPSWAAAGYFALVSVKTSKEEQAELDQIGIETFHTYKEIEEGKHPYLSKETLRFLPVYCSEDTDAGLENLIKRGLIPKGEPFSLDFKGGVRQEGFVRYMSYFMDTTVLMRQLLAEVKRRLIPVDMKKVHSFEELQEEQIFNCSGLGAKELCSDEQMIPVRGHLIALNQNAGSGHMDYLIYTKVKQDGKEEYLCLFPKTVCVSEANPEGVYSNSVLGGTFIPNVDHLSKEEQKKIDETEFSKILDRSSQFFFGHCFKG